MEKNLKVNEAGLRKSGHTFKAVLRCLLKASESPDCLVYYVAATNQDVNRVFDLIRFFIVDFGLVAREVDKTVVFPNGSKVRFVNRYHYENSSRGLTHTAFHDYVAD